LWWRAGSAPTRCRAAPGQVSQCGMTRSNHEGARTSRKSTLCPGFGSSQVGSSLFGSRVFRWVTESPFFAGRPFDSTKGFPGEGPPRSDIRVVTLNANANGSALRFIKNHGAEVDIFLLQEIKVAHEPKKQGAECPVEVFRDKLLKMGFKSTVAGARVTEKNGRSGGVAIAWRGHLNVTSPLVLHPHRAVSVDLHTHGAGDINLVCVYGDVLGTWKAQAELWRSVSRAAARSGKPFIWGGDWNASVPEVQEVIGSLNIPGTTVAPLRSTCVTPCGGSVIDFFVIHDKLRDWSNEAQVYKEGYTAPHRPVGMLIKGQQERRLIEVHKRPPALREPMGYGPHRVFDDQLAAAAHEATVFMNQQGIMAGEPNTTRAMTPEVDQQLTALFEAWYSWAEVELEQRFGFGHKPEQAIEVKQVQVRSLLATHNADRPIPSAALRFMRDRVHETRGDSWRSRSSQARFKAITPARIAWLGINLKGKHDEALGAFKKCYRTRLGNLGRAAPEEEALLGQLCGALEAETKSEWAISRSDWVEFIENDIKKGGKSIHSITRLAEAPPVGEVEVGGVTRSDDQAMLHSEHLKWSKIWGMDDPADPAPWNSGVVKVLVPPPAGWWVIQRVARSFPWHTSNYEGLSPRHVSELPEQGLRLLAQLFNLCEVYGDYPEVLRNLFVKLIPKPTGGFRPICLFRSLYRIHMKARSGHVRQWEGEVGRKVQGFNNEPGRRITDAMYRDGIRGDILGSEGPSYHGVELLRDLAKAFEAVRRDKLWDVAERHGYPGWLLRLSLNAYGWGRRLEMQAGMVGPKIEVNRGICAGSAHATYELKLYLLDYLCEATSRFSWLKISIHVDDFSLFVKGANDDECLVRLEESAAHMDSALEGLMMKQAKDKEEVLATSDSLASKAARMLKVTGGKVPNRAVKLGADYALRRVGPSRKVRQKARLNRFRARLSKATKMLDRSHRALAKVFVTGLVPGALYAAEISDFSQKDISGLRTAALRCANLNAGGVHNTFKWALLGAKFDPEVAVHLAPVLAFAREVWANGMRRKEGFVFPADGLDGTEIWKVQKRVSAIMEDGAGPGQSQARAGSSLARLAKGLTFFGARFTKVGHLTLRGGGEADLSICSPRLLEGKLVAGKDTQVAQEAYLKVWGTPGELDVSVLRRATKVAGHSRGFVAKVVAGAIYTRSKAMRYGTLDHEECPTCAGIADTQVHRVMDCKNSNTDGDKPGKKAWKVLGDQEVPNVPERACTATVWPPPRLLPLELEITRDPGQGGAFWFHNRSPVYIDGSGMFGKVLEVRTAASAGVQRRDGTDEEWDALSWPVPDELDQTSVVSEILALLLVLRHLRKGLEYIVYADCMAVIYGFAKTYKDLQGKGRHDGLWKQIFEAREGLQVELRKTKAHRSKLQAIQEDDMENFDGNEAADREAKRSANKYGHPPAACEEAEARQVAKRKGVAWTLAILKQAAIDIPEVPRRVSRAVRAARKTADWEGFGCLLVPSVWGGLICKVCFGKVETRSAKVTKCKGLNAAARKVIACGGTHGHALWVGRQVGGAYDGSPLFMCRSCGAYATAQCKALKKPCTRSWGGRLNGYNRFMVGKHPCLPKVLVEGQRSISDFEAGGGLLPVSRCSAHGASMSEGGIKRLGAGLPDGGQGPARRVAPAFSGLPGSSQGFDDPSQGAQVGGVGMAAWDPDDPFGEVGRPPEVSGGELSASEVDDFFGLR
jgi:exonuclease III